MAQKSLFDYFPKQSPFEQPIAIKKMVSLTFFMKNRTIGNSTPVNPSDYSVWANFFGYKRFFAASLLRIQPIAAGLMAAIAFGYCFAKASSTGMGNNLFGRRAVRMIFLILAIILG